MNWSETVTEKTETKSSEWYRKVFREDYLWLYAHRSEEEARRHVATALEHLPFTEGQKVLDVACGAGRHLLALARRGAVVTGVDLSEPLLERARERFEAETLSGTFVHGDMRRLSYKEEFDGATIWFTSFGYFESVDADYEVLEGLAAALKPGGWWWVDLPNPAYLERNLVADSERVTKGPHGRAAIREKRRMTDTHVIKEMTVTDGLGERSYEERVRLYRPEQFGGLAARAGLAADGILGGYDGSPLNPDHPRQIWYGRKLMVK